MAMDVDAFILILATSIAPLHMIHASAPLSTNMRPVCFLLARDRTQRSATYCIGRALLYLTMQNLSAVRPPRLHLEADGAMTGCARGQAGRDL